MEKLTRRRLKDFVFNPSVSIVIATAARLNLFRHLTKGLFAVNWAEAEEFYKHLKTFQVRKILDVGAGSCLWSLPFVKHEPDAHATAIDFPNVLNGSAKPIL